VDDDFAAATARRDAPTSIEEDAAGREMAEGSAPLNFFSHKAASTPDWFSIHLRWDKSY